jgi:hypothetical protein
MPKKPSASARGLDYKHRQRREMLLRNLVDGTPCPAEGCGLPMYKNPLMNFDGAALEADHQEERAVVGNFGSRANRLLHKKCNARLGGQLRARLAGQRLRGDGEQLEPVDLGVRLLRWPW